MRIEGTCRHCNSHIAVVVPLPASYDEIGGALMRAHETANPKCDDGWFIEGLDGAMCTSGIEDQVRDEPRVCGACQRSPEACECWLRCDCGWLFPRGESCRNSHERVFIRVPKGWVEPPAPSAPMVAPATFYEIEQPAPKAEPAKQEPPPQPVDPAEAFDQFRAAQARKAGK